MTVNASDASQQPPSFENVTQETNQEEFILIFHSWVLWGQVIVDEAVTLDGEFGNGFGRDVSLSADGQVISFQTKSATGIWEPLGLSLASDGVGFSMALSRDGLTVASGSFAGISCARTFHYDQTQESWFVWGNQNVFLRQRGVCRSGIAVALSSGGTRLAMGGVSDDNLDDGENGPSGVGQVRVFEYDRQSDEWEEIGQTLDVGEDGFGITLNLSADGSVLPSHSVLVLVRPARSRSFG